MYVVSRGIVLLTYWPAGINWIEQSWSVMSGLIWWKLKQPRLSADGIGKPCSEPVYSITVHTVNQQGALYITARTFRRLQMTCQCTRMSGDSARDPDQQRCSSAPLARRSCDSALSAVPRRLHDIRAMPQAVGDTPTTNRSLGLQSRPAGSCMPPRVSSHVMPRCIVSTKNKCQLTQTDSRDALPHAHRAIHRCGRSVW